MNNPRMIVGLSVPLYLAFGLMGCAEACNAEERAYDKEHRELLNLPQGSVSERGRTIPRAPQGGLRLCALNKRELPRLHSARVNRVLAARLEFTALVCSLTPRPWI